MEKLYNKLKEKHNLPDFDVLNREFELYTIEDENFLLRSIRKKVIDKADSAIKIFDDILHPDPGFASFKESNVFDEQDRERMLITYRRLMFFKRSATELFFEDSEEANAGFINSFMKEWPELKRSVLAFTKRLRDSWEKDIAKKEVVGYLG